MLFLITKKTDLFTFNNSNIGNIRFACFTSQTKKLSVNIFWSISCFAVFGGHVAFSPVDVIYFYKYYYFQRNCLPTAYKM